MRPKQGAFLLFFTLRVTKMKPNLPFASLRTFESVARLRGFGRAAEELGVSQSAVSQHVKALEKWLGVRLVRRGSGQVLPTRQGDLLAAAVGDSFAAVAVLCQDLRASAGRRPSVTLSCPAGLAKAWLLPRLAGFDAAHPDLPLSVVTAPPGAPLPDDEVDIVIHHAAGGVPGMHCERLMTEQILPVCAPGLAVGPAPLRGVADLAQHTLLHEDLRGAGAAAAGWRHWASQSGLALPTPLRERYFDGADLVLAAAEAGLGVAMGRRPVVDAALAAGRLVAPFGTPVTTEARYWLVFLPGAQTSARVRAVRDWLLATAAQSGGQA